MNVHEWFSYIERSCMKCVLFHVHIICRGELVMDYHLRQDEVRVSNLPPILQSRTPYDFMRFYGFDNKTTFITEGTLYIC